MTPPPRNPSRPLTRRRFLVGGGAAAVALGSVGIAAAGSLTENLHASSFAAAGALSGNAPHWLELVNTHTAESLQIVYRNAGGLVTPALQRLQWLLRDHRRNEAAPIDVGVYDQLVALATAAGVEPRYEVISGYRSPQTNAVLRGRSGGVATRSLHMQGRAIDVRLHGVSCADLRDLAIAAGRGGVGYYRSSDFVHLDTGRVRRWAG